jgi:hypothetical protein
MALDTSARINPYEINGTITSTGLENGIGPYKFRKGGISVDMGATSSNSTDVVQVDVVFPGKDPSDSNNVILSFTDQTVPISFTVVGDFQELKGPCDIYLYATTCTGTIEAKLISNSYNATGRRG